MSSITPRERLLACLRREIPDCVPVCPDISNMVPCRLTGKPFWDIYAFKDPPLWKAHIHALNKFDLDGGFEIYDFGPVDVFDEDPHVVWEQRVIHRYADGRFVTRQFNTRNGAWAPTIVVYTKDNPPASGVKPGTVGLPDCPTEWEPLTGVKVKGAPLTERETVAVEFFSRWQLVQAPF